jgi:SAM-dependent methyltransferase
MSETKKAFDAASLKWDSPPKILSAGFISGILSARYLNGHESTRVLEIGSGTGNSSLSMLTVPRMEYLLCVDESEGMTDAHRAKVDMIAMMDPEIKTRIEIRCGLFENVMKEGEDGDGLFDLIFMNMAFHHVLNSAKLMQQLIKFLKPGGSVVVIDIVKSELSEQFHPPHMRPSVVVPGFDPEEVVKMMKDSGVSTASHFTVMNMPHPIMKEDGSKVPMSFPIFLCEGTK